MERDHGREARFGAGLVRIGNAVRHEPSETTLEIYAEALCYQVDAETWEAFTKHSVASGRWSWFPKVKEILDALAEFQGSGRAELLKTADAAYEAVKSAGSYSAETGTTWTYRAVRDALGEVAALAFLDAGGGPSFGYGHDDQRRRLFVAAFMRESEELAREQRLLSSSPRKELRP